MIINFQIFFIILSIISLIAINYFFFIQKNELMMLLFGSLANAIQVIQFTVEYFKKETPLEKNVEDIKRWVIEDKEKYDIKEKLISELINIGLINETDINDLLSDKEVVIAFLYASALPKRIYELINYRPHLKIFEQIGFIRITFNQNIYFAFKERLPKNIRKLNNLEIYVEKEIKDEWEIIKNKVVKRFPKDKYKIFENYRDGSGFNFSYILYEGNYKDIKIGYLNNLTFKYDFIEYIGSIINNKRLLDKINLNKIQIKIILSKVSIDFYLRDIIMTSYTKNAIINNEKMIKEKLGIEMFTDYKSKEPEELKSIFKEILPRTSEEKLLEYGKKIIEDSKEVYNLLENIGIHLG